jgi:hypothetical protein
MGHLAMVLATGLFFVALAQDVWALLICTGSLTYEQHWSAAWQLSRAPYSFNHLPGVLGRERTVMPYFPQHLDA